MGRCGTAIAGVVESRQQVESTVTGSLVEEQTMIKPRRRWFETDKIKAFLKRRAIQRAKGEPSKEQTGKLGGATSENDAGFARRWRTFGLPTLKHRLLISSHWIDCP